ncbi:MAG: J domain-containing protein [Bacteroidia bacterium]|nr:J domain-containing protein [Bacteroidia bacterium]
MSYSQILRRLSRVLKSTVNDVLDNFSQEAKDLHDFDEELRRGAQGGEPESGPRSQSSSSGTNTGRSHSSGRQEHHGGNRSEGKRKPGEREDAWYFTRLGLTPDASDEQIRKTYRKLMAQYHPDRVATLSAEQQAAAAEKAKIINEAYQIIARRRGIR